MKSDTILDYAAFQLSPKRSRCELFVSSNGTIEKLASGLVKPFVSHLKAAEEQVALPVQSIKLEVERHKKVEPWFTKGTLERFVRFVSTPEVLELVSTFDAEMSQLEGARRIYSQGSSDQLSSTLGAGRSSSAAGADATKEELLRAIDVRLTAVKQDLSTACARAAAAGFNHHTVADLQLFAERFGATRLNEACCKYVSLNDRRPELFNSQSWKSGVGDQAIRSSYSSDMSIDDDPPTTKQSSSLDQAHAISQPPRSLSSSVTIFEKESKKKEEVAGGGGAEEPLAQPVPQPSSRRLSVQDRINLFENKQKEVVGSTSTSRIGGAPAVTKPELRRLSSSDALHSHPTPPPAVLRRWSGASDMSMDLSGDTTRRSEEVVPTTKVGSTVSSSVKSEESVGSNQLTSNLEKTHSFSSLTKSEDDSLDVPIKSRTQIKSFHGDKGEQLGEFKPSTVEPLEAESRAPSKKIGGSGSKFKEAIAASQQRGLEIGSLRSQPRSNSSAETEEFEKKDSPSTVKQLGESGLDKIEKMKFQEQVQRNESKSVYGTGYSKTPPSGKYVNEGSGSIPMEASIEQTHRSRQLKGNQELNDELKIKANELEKLFAEHKLRIPENRKPSDIDIDEQKTAFASPVPVKEVDGVNHSNALQRSFSEIGYSDGSRGKLYDSYMKKRDERLRELWGSNRAEKEARMKAMNDILERNSAEMKTKLSWSIDGQDSISSTRRRAERLRSFSARSAMKREQPLDFGQIEDDEDLSELSELKPFGNSVSRGKKPLPFKNSTTSTPRTMAAPIPKSATKVASSSGRRRLQSDNHNPLAQSVPNFSDLRKENTKPYYAATKAATRSQLRNYTRSRSTNEETPSVKEEKGRRSQSLRKNSPTPPEISEGVILTPLKFDKEQSESLYMKSSKMESKPFLMKNNGIGKMKASMAYEAMNNEDEYDQLVSDLDGITMKTEGQAVVDVMESKMSQESEVLLNSESDNGDGSQSLSQVDPTVVAVQDSPDASPTSWNSRTQEASDIDAYADSPMGSPGTWNLQALNPAEADAARMRKKWGSAQKPVLVTHSSGVQSRKDMTKGFKRLLKFGRKSRGTESLADWISATTSEGDDDTEDGRDPANRSSEDLRKSRMGYAHGLPSEDSFNESDFFTDQVHGSQSSIPAPPANFRLREDHLSGSSIKAPRSFFSLSSFRSKGSESKPR